MIWEARLDQSEKPSAQANRDRRLRFITAKYVDRAYVNPITANMSHFSSADETLLASVKKNDVQGVLYALALRANPNASDRSRNTHSVFLALAAADPAAPAGISATPSPHSRSSSNNKPPPVTAFPIAELLVQNGSIIPSTMPAFPLSTSAQLYIDQKTSKDVLSELPVIGKPGGLEKQSESAKLQKRPNRGGPTLAVRPG